MTALHTILNLYFKAKDLGLFEKPYSLQDLLAISPDMPFNLKLVERPRQLNHGFKRYKKLDEIENPDAIIANSETGFYVLDTDESAIFFSYPDPDKSMVLQFNTIDII